MTIQVWSDYVFYDQWWATHRGLVVGEGSVKWMGETLPNVQGTASTSKEEAARG